MDSLISSLLIFSNFISSPISFKIFPQKWCNLQFQEFCSYLSKFTSWTRYFVMLNHTAWSYDDAVCCSKLYHYNRKTIFFFFLTHDDCMVILLDMVIFGLYTASFLPSGFRLDVATTTTPCSHSNVNKRFRIIASAISVTWNSQM